MNPEYVKAQRNGQQTTSFKYGGFQIVGRAQSQRLISFCTGLPLSVMSCSLVFINAQAVIRIDDMRSSVDTQRACLLLSTVSSVELFSGV